MGIFDRIRGWFGGGGNEPERSEEEIRNEIVSELSEPDEELADVWNAFADEIDVEDLDTFAHDDFGLELFDAGWVNIEAEGEDLANIRAEFFELMEAYDISKEEFDWDAWRDWYEDA